MTLRSPATASECHPVVQDVQVKTTKVILDERGRLMEMLRADDKLFKELGRVYMTRAYLGAVKPLHCRQKQDAL